MFRMSSISPVNCRPGSARELKSTDGFLITSRAREDIKTQLRGAETKRLGAGRLLPQQPANLHSFSVAFPGVSATTRYVARVLHEP